MNAKEKIECFCGDYIASIVQASEGDECLVDETHRIQFSSNTYSAKKITSQFLSIAALVIELLHGK